MLILINMDWLILKWNAFLIVFVIMMSLVCVKLVLLVDDKRLREQHSGYTDKSYQQEEDADALLSTGGPDD